MSPRRQAVPTVAVTSVVRGASILVFVCCFLSLTFWFTAGVFFISPLVSMLGCGAAAMFYGLSAVAEREWNDGG